MWQRNRVILPFVLASLAGLLACGSSNNAVPPPSGGFSNSNLSGTYVFSSTGVDANGIFLAVVGTLQADGKGGINGGMIDVNGLDVGPSSSAITSGNYAISVDGRGRATLNSNTSLAPSIGLAFVLTSGGGMSSVSSHGLVTEFDGNGTGSGTIDLQSTGSLQSSYGFEFSGATASGGTELPFAMAGAFTVGGTGTISSGIADINNNGISTGGTNGLTLTGSVAAGAPGKASLSTSAGTFNFDVYMVDSTHLKFIETDALPAVAGDAFTQEASIPAGVLTYTMGGADVGGLPLAMGGFMTSDGSKDISAGFEDYNDAGMVNTTPVPTFSGSYTPLSGGRTVLTLNSIYNGDNQILTPTVTFAAYPTSGGIGLLEIDSAGVTGGVAFAQTATSFAASQGYGLNLTAINGGNGSGEFEEDDIAEFTVNADNTFKGLEDINDEGSGASGQAFSGKLKPDTTIPGHGFATSNEFNFNYYVVDGSTVLILETDQTQVGFGSFLEQGSIQVGASPQTHFMIVRPKASARIAGRQRNK